MTRRIVLSAVLLTLLSPGCSPIITGVQDRAGPQKKADATPDEVVAHFVKELEAVAGEFPELSEFQKRDRKGDRALEVRFARGVGKITEMRAVRPTDLEPKGIWLDFLLRKKDDPVWTELTPRSLIDLDHLGLDLYSGFVLSSQASKGLAERLTAIFERHRTWLEEINRKIASKETEPTL